GAGGGGDGESAGIGRADSGSDRGDFVLGLESDDAEILILRKLMQDVGRGGNRVAALEQLEAGFLRGGNEAERECLVAADVAIQTGFKLRRRNLVADLESFGGFAVGVAGLHG